MGTSTGGIISLGLATQDRPIWKLKKEFLALATETFRRKRLGTVWTGFNPFRWTSKAFLILHIWDSIYPTTPLRDELQRLFGQDRMLPVLGDAIDFEREDEIGKDMKIWEAALATAAAPFYVRKFEKTETGKDYTDRALHANFPVPYCLSEIARVWGRLGGEKTPIDILLSLGTGIQKREISIPTALKIGGFEAICTSFHSNLDCERKWREFERESADDSDIGGKVHRLNAHISGNYVALDNYKQMAQIDRDISTQSLDPKFAMDIERIADSLIANLFFFEPTVTKRDSITPAAQHKSLSGFIRCRLAKDSQCLKNLADIIEGFWYHELHDTANNPPPPSTSQWAAIEFTEQLRQGIKHHQQWLRVDCSINPTETHSAQQILAVTLKRNIIGRRLPSLTDPIPISGFPITFESLRKRALA
ncbi:MAG: hypothetical protein M1839_006755 [Geoglossum umbratile]|nr:MAG: hypothetical protein M1839_006755 [Geoglossum umbratile]